MHIVELRIAGFKSFVDPVRLTIEAGLTGVVGPNGCGKSNLLEAVRWGMGATSAKAMRAGDMDDVIFAGSNARPAREHAEVALVLEPTGGRPPPGVPVADRLEIARRIRREAGSTYRINGKEVRAKDVQLLFADASTGANSPALVRQGQISELIAARPENRRRILEEAAGIAGLHARRHEADLKLNAASANLQRLSEVTAEIDAQRSTLKRQARLAERYRTLADEIRKLEALALHRRLLEAGDAFGQAEAEVRAAERAVAAAATAASAAQRTLEDERARLPPLREEELIAAAVLRRLEGDRVGLARDQQAAEDALRRARAEQSRHAAEMEREERAIAEAAAEVARLEAEAETLGGDDDEAPLAAARARAAEALTARQTAEAALDAARAGESEVRARRIALDAKIVDAARRLQRQEERAAALLQEEARLPAPGALLAGLAAATAALADAETRAALAHAALEEAERKAAAAEQRLSDARAAHAVAEKARAETAAEIRALEAVARQPKASAHEAALTRLEVEPGFEAAVAAALGDDAAAALDAEAPFRWTGARVRSMIWPTDATPLRDFVKGPKSLDARIDACAVVDRAVGAALQPHLGAGARLVSREGDLWRWDGLVREAGAPSSTATLLQQRNRLTKLNTQLVGATENAQRAEGALEEARLDHAAATTAAKAAATAGPRALQEMLSAKAALTAAKAACERRDTQHNDLALRQSELAAEIEALQAIIAADRETLSALPVPDDAAIARAKAEADAARAAAAEAEAQVRVLDRARAQRADRLSAVAAERRAWNDRLAQASARLQSAKDLEHAARTQLQDLSDAPGRATVALQALLNEITIAERREASARDALAEAERMVREAEAKFRTAEAALSALREKRAALGGALSTAMERRSTLEAQAREQCQSEPDQLAAKVADLAGSALGRGPLPDIERRIERLKSDRDQGGPVNLRAEEELEEVEARLATLLAERADVDAAIGKLRQAIGKLNGEARRRLLAAHAVVNGHFADLFATLFEGGQAELRLTEAEDPLQSGLDIFAQPPGKRLSNLSLMSGGEQALTAAALIFAVFLANPAPICVLDEVDAPLDDANVDRFCKLLEEMKKRTETRFLVITHNPVTMSRMDRLFGVTMAERGVSQIVSVDLQRAAELAAE